MLDSHQSSASDHDIASDNIRSWTRFQPDASGIWLIADNRPKQATAFDESYGGIGLAIATPDAVGISVGDDVVVNYYGYPTRGCVQWTQEDCEAKLVRIGIEWSMP